MSTDSAVRSRGRPREFDVDVVLDRVVTLFWEQGFEATSMSDIVEATGLNKSSLYNSFGSKDQLFQMALERYLTMFRQMLRAGLRDGSSGLDDITSFLDMVESEVGREFGTRGCLAVNTTTELGHCDESVVAMSAEYRGEMRSGFRAALDRAVTRGEIRASDAAPAAEILVAFMLSMSVFARGRASATEIDGQFAAIHSIVEAWRIER